MPLFLLLELCVPSHAGQFGWTSDNSLALPSPGDHQLRILSPTLLELTMISTKTNTAAPVQPWDFVGADFKLQLPPLSAFQVSAAGSTLGVKSVGLKRRPLYAPNKQRDLRILNQLYLVLSEPIREGAQVRVTNPDGKLWDSKTTFHAIAQPLRFNPAIHVNQVGSQPGFPKTAMIGYYLGSLGEMEIPHEAGFQLVDREGKAVFKGALARRPDRGFTYSPAPYQQVWEADFSKFDAPGEYRLLVPGLGASYPFRIHEGTIAAFTRTLALGLYHQRCGTSNNLPFTRHVHEACHTAPVELPGSKHTNALKILAEVASAAAELPGLSAPLLTNFSASLYPFVRQGKIDARGGHHDAGDYSKYTINSAALVHYLVFAADNFPGAAELDNLGLPESGDGKSDLLQEAKWEADFLAKMQDQDGGFYFLVYPRDRRYEDVLPDESDPQIVWPKNTAATAAASAALAEAGSSPVMRKQFPEAARLYLQTALRGWEFLERALAKHGREGSYQFLTHYGNEFRHDDELAWAAAALFCATGEKKFEQFLIESFDPANPGTRRWSWWPLFEGYGCAVRTYAFASRNGRLRKNEQSPAFLATCLSLIDETARNHVRFAADTAYGTSFPDPSKASLNAGWYFSSERAFDITVARQLREDDDFRRVVLSNLNYEAGCNPVNVSYITGLGWRRQREMVHQFAQHDRRVLPPSGLPIGNIQSGFAWLHHYQKELGAIPFPPDGAQQAPYPYYDRWGDSYNTSTEFVIVDQARSLASLSYWMAQTPLKNQKWRAADARITGLPKSAPAGKPVTANLVVEGLDLSAARVVWEAREQEPVFARQLAFTPSEVGEQWVEAEACWPDGRRAFASTKFTATTAADTLPNPHFSAPLEPTPDTIALYHFDGALSDATGKSPELKLSGNPALDESNLGWMKKRQGAALHFSGLGDTATASIRVPGGSSSIELQAMLYINEYKAYNLTNAKILSLAEDWHSSLEFIENIYEGPMIRGGTLFSLNRSQITNALTPRTWHHLLLRVDKNGYSAAVDGKVIARTNRSEISNWGRQAATLNLGNFDGYLDEIAIIATGAGANLRSSATAKPGETTEPQPASASSTPSPATSISRPLSTPFVVGQTNAAFLAEDAATAGAWEQRYGKAGFKLSGSAAEIPAGAAIHPLGAETYTWKENTPDPRALRRPHSESGVAACWFALESFKVRIDPSDSQPQLLSVYCLDWDRAGRVQQISVTPVGSDKPLDRRTVADFGEGKYLSWLISGPVELQFQKLAGPNTVLMGIFLDPPSAEVQKRIDHALRN